MPPAAEKRRIGVSVATEGGRGDMSGRCTCLVEEPSRRARSPRRRCRSASSGSRIPDRNSRAGTPRTATVIAAAPPGGWRVRVSDMTPIASPTATPTANASWPIATPDGKPGGGSRMIRSHRSPARAGVRGLAGTAKSENGRGPDRGDDPGLGRWSDPRSAFRQGQSARSPIPGAGAGCGPGRARVRAGQDRAEDLPARPSAATSSGHHGEGL